MAMACALTIGSDTRYLGPLRQWIDAFSRVSGERWFPRRAVIPCSMALVEAVDNAIFHAHGGRRREPIDISLSVKKGRIIIDVVDRGSGIGNPERIEPDSQATHGRGLFIIREIMDRVRSRRIAGRHHMRMEYKI